MLCVVGEKLLPRWHAPTNVRCYSPQPPHADAGTTIGQEIVRDYEPLLLKTNLQVFVVRMPGSSPTVAFQTVQSAMGFPNLGSHKTDLMSRFAVRVELTEGGMVGNVRTRRRGDLPHSSGDFIRRWQ
jgi:hypothetical protein